MRHAVIDKNSSTVVNVIVYDGNSPWQPPPNCFIVASEIADMGDFYNTESKTFSKFYALD